MNLQDLLPLAASVLLCVAGPRIGHRLPPATAVRVLTITALLNALATGFVLTVAAFTAVAQVPQVARFGHWSPNALRASGSVPPVLGGSAGVAVVLLMAVTMRFVVRTGRDLVVAELLCRRLGRDGGDLVVLQDDAPDAYALPGMGGRIVVSTGMLRALSAAERRVLLAHEAAHLTHRHYAYVQGAALAAAANPFLRPVAAAVSAGVERWADEVAAREVGDRSLAARALARAGLARATAHSDAQSSPPAALNAAAGNVADRARALLKPAPRRRTGLTAAITAIALASCVSALTTARDTEHRFEKAGTHPYAATTPHRLSPDTRGYR